MVIPAIVSAIYGEETMRAIFNHKCCLNGIVFDFRAQKAGECDDLCKGRICDCGAGMDSMVRIRSTSVFIFSGTIPKYIDALVLRLCPVLQQQVLLFLTDIASLPMGMNFWRCLTHWIGGMGVLVFVLVLTSLDDKNTMHLMRAEVPGPEADKLVPKVRGQQNFIWNVSCADVDRSWIFCLREE